MTPHIQQIVIDQTATVNFAPIILGTSTPGARDFLHDLYGPGIW